MFKRKRNGGRKRFFRKPRRFARHRRGIKMPGAVKNVGFGKSSEKSFVHKRLSRGLKKFYRKYKFPRSCVVTHEQFIDVKAGTGVFTPVILKPMDNAQTISGYLQGFAARWKEFRIKKVNCYLNTVASGPVFHIGGSTDVPIELDVMKVKERVIWKPQGYNDAPFISGSPIGNDLDADVHTCLLSQGKQAKSVIIPTDLVSWTVGGREDGFTAPAEDKIVTHNRMMWRQMDVANNFAKVIGYLQNDSEYPAGWSQGDVVKVRVRMSVVVEFRYWKAVNIGSSDFTGSNDLLVKPTS